MVTRPVQPPHCCAIPLDQAGPRAAQCGCYSPAALPIPRSPLRARAGLALGAAIAALSSLAPALAQPIEREAWASLGRRTLVERSAGALLLTEEGPMARAGIRVVRPWPSGAAVALEASFGLAQLDYDGQTSITAIPVQTTTRQAETEIDVLFSPDRHWAGGEVWFSLGLLENRRLILGTALTRDLYERSEALMAGLRYRTPVFSAPAGWTLRAEADLRASLQHRLHVNFYGLLSPGRMSLRGGDKDLVRLRLVGRASGSPWEWGLEWSRMSQGISGSANATGFGLNLVVSQPPLVIRDVSLRLTRRF